jgi:DNA-binding NtrC family response regulator
LNVIPLDLVPLKDRGEDVQLLFNYFLTYFSNDMGIPIPEVESGAKDILSNYKWPGNVRELRNVAQRLLLNCEGTIAAKDVSHPMILKGALSREESAGENEFSGRQVLPYRRWSGYTGLTTSNMCGASRVPVKCGRNSTSPRQTSSVCARNSGLK